MRNVVRVVVAVLGVVLCVSPAGALERPGRGPWVPIWTVTYGGFRQADDLAAVGPDEAWAVDASTVTSAGAQYGETAFVHLTAGIWRVTQVVRDAQLTSIALSAPDFGFAVGDAGVIYQWDGRYWQPAPSPVRRRLVDIALLSATEGWAVGDLGTLIGWDGTAWRPVETPTYSVALTAVTIPAHGEAWATAREGQVIHLTEGRWERATVAGVVDPRDIAFASPGRALIVGRTVVELRDGAWRTVPISLTRCTSVAWAGDTAYVTVDNRIRSYRDGRWATVPLVPPGIVETEPAFTRVVGAPGGPWGLAQDGTIARIGAAGASYVRPVSPSLGAIDMVDTEFGWAGGRSVSAGFVGTRDGPWSLEQALPRGVVVRAIDLVSRTDGWAVGADETGQARMWRWDGTRWSDWAIDKTWELSDLQMLGADEGWAGGGNAIVRWDGQAWTQVPGVPDQAAAGGLAIVRGGADPEGWFGSYGYAFHLHDGTWDWVPMTGLGPGRDLVTDIDMPGPRDGWAVTPGALFHYDGERWQKTDLPMSSDAVIRDVSAPELDNAWVLVTADGLFHWDGNRWEYHDLAPMGAGFHPLALRALRPAGDTLANDVWMVGSWPSVGRYRVVTPVGTIRLPVLARGARLTGR
jgi:hypothetical protein